MAKEYKPLRINVVSPGVIDTSWRDSLPAEVKKETVDSYTSQIAAGRIGEPDDIAHTIQLLTENEYMTGKVITCDGRLA
ncbi:SDR family oxidoreductase [Niabella ginsenosidivorans]|uniref:SDR family oxidoreductase n=1 Tax=Niabella ginsenosidivorans TaxID=1176587 RepID=UPI001C54D415|nr:SDR family oxidoreductase [Niabella ginsenosidivorans]